MRRYLLVLLLVPFIFSTNISVWETKNLNVSTATVSNLINLSTNFDSFKMMIPGYEYEGEINVSMVLPEESLYGLVEKRVVVFVNMAQANNANSCIQYYFKNGNVTSIGKYSVLYCEVVGGKCAVNEYTHKNFKVYFINKKTAFSNCSNVELVVNASLYPFSEQINQTDIAKIEFDNLLTQIKNLGINESQVDGLEDIKESIGIFDSENAMGGVEDAKRRVSSIIYINKSTNSGLDINESIYSNKNTNLSQNSSKNTNKTKIDVNSANASLNIDIVVVFIGMLLLAGAVIYVMKKRNGGKIKLFDLND